MEKLCGIVSLILLVVPANATWYCLDQYHHRVRPGQTYVAGCYECLCRYPQEPVCRRRQTSYPHIHPDYDTGPSYLIQPDYTHYPVPQNVYPPTNNRYPPTNNRYPPTNNRYPLYPPTQDMYPPTQNMYPPTKNEFPPTNIAYEPTQNVYPPTQNVYRPLVTPSIREVEPEIRLHPVDKGTVDVTPPSKATPSQHVDTPLEPVFHINPVKTIPH